MNWVWQNLPDIVDGVSYIVTGASVVAAIAPNPRVSKALAGARKVLDFLACNFGNAKNAK